MFPKDLRLNIGEIDVEPINRKICFKDILVDGGINHNKYLHSLFKITLRSGEAWAFDPTCSQFGYSNPLDPWTEYRKTRVKKVQRKCTFGQNREEAYSIPISAAGKMLTPVKLLSDSLNAQIAGWVDEYKEDLSTVPRGTTFTAAKDNFLDKLEAHVKLAMGDITHTYENRM